MPGNSDKKTSVLKLDLPMVDRLATIRSVLANERTFLSYQRTALTFTVAGFSFIKFFHDFWFIVIGWLFLPAALLTFSIGIYRYLRMRNTIHNLESKSSNNVHLEEIIGE